MNRVLLLLVLLPAFVVNGQNALYDEFFSRMKPAAGLPEKLLSTRSVVVYSHNMTDKELNLIQENCGEIGIDAVAYYDLDVMLAGKDMGQALSFTFNKRGIENLVIICKAAKFKAYITPFNTKSTFVEANQVAWMGEDASLAELLRTIRRTAGTLTRTNLLINDFPETDLEVNPITGRRSEFVAIDLKVDPLAVPLFGDTRDKDLESIMAAYPFKYKLTKPGLPERELRVQGSLYVLCYVYTRGSVARQVLGYDTTKPESAFVSITYPNGQPVMKTYAADEYVYKFYFKHIDSGNVFLGTKWDADTSWQQALKNHLMAFKSELKLN